MQELFDTYIYLGVACGVIAFLLMLPNTRFRPIHMLSAAIAAVVVAILWPAWLVYAVFRKVAA